MNWVQKFFMWIGIGAIGLMILCPPWIEKLAMPKDYGTLQKFVGYRSLFAAPHRYKSGYPKSIRIIDFQRLGLQVGLVVLLIGGAIVTAHKKGKHVPPNEKTPRLDSAKYKDTQVAPREHEPTQGDNRREQADAEGEQILEEGKHESAQEDERNQAMVEQEQIPEAREHEATQEHEINQAMIKREQILQGYDIRDGLIASPGKFKGQPLYIPYFWEKALNGSCDYERIKGEKGAVAGFRITEEDKHVFPELEDISELEIWKTQDGFVLSKVKGGLPKGIGGWLILPLLNLLITPILAFISIMRALRCVLDAEIWAALTTPGTNAYHPLWGSAIVFEIVAFTVIFALSIWLLLLFFRKSKRVPKLFIAFILLIAFVNIADSIFVSEILSESIEMKYAMGGVLWIWYFLKSKRVKNTFVE